MENEKIEVSGILERTLQVTSRTIGGSLLYVAALGALGTALDIAGSSTSIVYTLASAGGGYLLLRAMLVQMGEIAVDAGKRFGAYFGLSLLSGLGILLGTILLVIPGFVLFVRWLPAYAILLSEERTVIESLSESWRRTEPHFWRLLAPSLLAVLLFAGSLLVYVANDIFPSIPLEAAAAVGNVLIAATAVFVTALGVAIFRSVSLDHRELSEVFA